MRVPFIVVVCIGLVLLMFSCQGLKQADGTKVGTVIKLSQEGVICKTWEGELIRGGMTNGSGGFSTTPLYFTVNDANLLRGVQEALDGQYEVEVRYAAYLGPMPCASGNAGNHFLTEIRHR